MIYSMLSCASAAANVTTNEADPQILQPIPCCSVTAKKQSHVGQNVPVHPEGF